MEATPSTAIACTEDFFQTINDCFDSKLNALGKQTTQSKHTIRISKSRIQSQAYSERERERVPRQKLEAPTRRLKAEREACYLSAQTSGFVLLTILFHSIISSSIYLEEISFCFPNFSICYILLPNSNSVLYPR